MRIKNFAKFQHFKDRCPPWVKLYRDLLNDIEWHELDPKAAKVLVSLWLIASEDETKQGVLPSVKHLAFRLRMTETEIKDIVFKLSHWLEQIDINSISEGYQDDAPEESRDKVEKEDKKLPPDGGDDIKSELFSYAKSIGIKASMVGKAIKEVGEIEAMAALQQSEGQESPVNAFAASIRNRKARIEAAGEAAEMLKPKRFDPAVLSI